MDMSDKEFKTCGCIVLIKDPNLIIKACLNPLHKKKNWNQHNPALKNGNRKGNNQFTNKNLKPFL